MASACLAVATLLNAPPGFLEFLLCMPWAQLPEVYSDWGDAGRLTSSIASLELLSGPEQQSHLVNWPLGQGLVDCVMDFLYRDEYRDSLPPMMALGPGEFVPGNGVAAGPVQRAVHAMLDGATALHCAAARGNPAQVDHLLMCGADPLSRNAAGELPMELVPRCADPSSGLNATCCCMGRGDQEAWECRSRVARMFILRRCVGMVRIGVLAWMRLMVLCLLCLMGLWGAHTSLVRPALEARGKACWQARRMKARARAKDTLNAMRSAVAEGREALSQLSGSRRLSRSSSSSPNGDPPLQGTLLLLYGVKVREPFSPVISGPSITVDVMCAGSNEGSLGDAHPHLNTSSYDSRCAQSRQASRAYAAFTSAVAVLQRISAQQGTNDIASVLVPEARHLPRKDWAEVEIPLEEQAAVYAGLAQAAVAVHDGCGCAGCEAVASSAVDSAVRELMGLFDAASAAWKDGGSEHEASQQLAGHLAAAIHLRATLLLRTDARRSATQSAIWRAQQCVAEWSRMRRLKARSSLSPDEVPLEVECLESWAATAAADVLLTEALLGEPVPPLQPLSEAAAAAVQRDASGALCLGQPTSKALLEQLKTALNVAGPLASEHIRVLAEGVAARATEEIQVGEHLRTLLRQRSSGGAGPTPEQLAAAAAAAAQFPSLADEVAQAATMQERWVQRNAAQEQLNGIVDAASAPAPLALLQECMADITAGLEAFRAEINRRLHELEAAVEGARVASISVSRAKKLQKDLQAQMAAVEAAVKLDEALHQTKAGSGAIKVMKWFLSRIIK